MRFTVEFYVADPAAAAKVLREIESDGKPWKVYEYQFARAVFDAADPYMATTYALLAQDQVKAATEVQSARIRTGSNMFGGPWFDLNEQA